jgi:predicted alpha/beta superfamily hydrolase
MLTTSWFINRSFDYTTTIDTAINKKTEKQFGFPEGTLNSGRAEKFLECIQKEIIPFVDKNYKTNTNRGLTGHL